jgi:hypothetical protein
MLTVVQTKPGAVRPSNSSLGGTQQSVPGSPAKPFQVEPPGPRTRHKEALPGGKTPRVQVVTWASPKSSAQSAVWNCSTREARTCRR